MKPLPLLFFALFNSILGLSVLFPVLAPLGRELGLTELQVGSLSTAYALMQLLISPYWGRRSERVGRKPVILTGIVGFALSFFGFGVVAHLGTKGVLSGGLLYGGLLAARLLGGTLSSATIPTAQAYVADVTDREKRTSGMAVIGAAFGLGIIFGPGIGAALSTFGLLVPVYFSAGMAVVNALFVWTSLPEPKRHEGRRVGNVALVDGRIWPLLAIGLAAALAAVSMEQTIAFLFQDRLSLDAKHTARAVGMALVVYGVVAVFAQGVLIRRLRLKPSTLLRVGVPVAALGLAGLVFANDFASLTVALAMQGLGQGFVSPGVTSALSLAVDDEQQGAVAGYNSSAQALGRMLGPLAGTALYQLKPAFPYAFACSLLVVVMVVILVAPQVVSPSPPAV